MAVRVRTIEGTEEQIEVRPGTCADILIDLGLCSLPPGAFRVWQDGRDVTGCQLAECDGATLVIRRPAEALPTQPRTAAPVRPIRQGRASRRTPLVAGVFGSLLVAGLLYGPMSTWISRGFPGRPGAVAAAPSTPLLPEALLQEALNATRPVLNPDAARSALAATRAATVRPPSGNVRGGRELNGRGLEALRSARLGDAVVTFERARAANPADIEIVANYGYALLQAGEIERATVVLKEAIAINPYYATAWLSLGRCLARLGHPNDGVAAIVLAHMLSKDPSVLVESLRRWERDPATPERERRMLRVALEAIGGRP
jgi:Flp pilus assembly protein TadD